ncbi:MAG: MerR family transcriptional regulator [Thermodesulfobacteriota bacterium]
MKTPHYSLREIGRMLGIPPSTVVYYRDRFESCLPRPLGRGRNRRYPQEALAVFGRIREMFEMNLSAEAVERELASRAKARGRDPEPGVSGPMAGLLARLDSLLADQALYRGELAALRREREAEARAAARRIADLEAAAAALRADRERLEARLAELIRRSNPLRSRPGRDFLRLPLVVRSRGEFLGVSGKAGATLSLEGFTGLIQRNADALRDVDMDWEQAGEGFVLAVRVTDRAAGRRQELRLEAAETTTPSGNRVVEVRGLTLDGREAPEPMLLTLFRQIRDQYL